jgi:hypothetical protein
MRDGLGVKRLVVITLALLTFGAGSAQGQPALKAIVEHASYIFEGTIVKAAATNVRSFPASPRTAVVRVDHVLDASKSFPDMTGRELTVELPSPKEVRSGTSLVFFTEPTVYAENIAVRASSVQPAAQVDKLRAQIADARQQLADDQLRQRLAAADLVVTGAVVSVRKVPPRRDAPARRSEHEPELWQAELSVQATLKGTPPPNKTITFSFVAGIDQMWALSPRFKGGEQGVFVLSKNTNPWITVTGPVIVDPLAYRPAPEEARVKQLLKARP